ncbi:hypothetical protein LIER_30708 [Lithospermum erythrorhizon]|uniref:BHLH domain-containing protein n=1 Tax=Lithospermum erythrorhizon TaxID=34254 RepID=A0AAV3RUE6_LITER
MDKDYFMNSNLAHQMPTWNNSFSATQEQQNMDNFINTTWNDPMHHINQVNSPQRSGGFILRELIGKLDSVNHSNEQIMDTNMINLKNNINSRTPSLPSLVSDPGFAERAAKFSCFGSKSFNGRSSELGCSKNELPYRSSSQLNKLPRVSSTPLLKQDGSLTEIKNLNSEQNLRRFAEYGGNCNENSSVSEQGGSGETGSKTTSESNSRKRKAVSRGKLKEDFEPSNLSNIEENANAKRSKLAKREGEAKGTNSNGEEEEIGNQKPPEPPKDYIHVRARRGQATDSHSLAERVRREKISERMKLLQDLVPGCNKVTGKALMLNEIINYVQALQSQVEFLSMKLSSVDSRMDFDEENHLSKEMYQPNTYLPQPMYPSDPSVVAALYGHHPQQIPQQQMNNRPSNVSVSQCSVKPLDGNTLNNFIGMQLPPLQGFVEGLPQFSALCEDDLQSIVQMGSNRNFRREIPFNSQGLYGRRMKIVHFYPEFYRCSKTFSQYY